MSDTKFLAGLIAMIVAATYLGPMTILGLYILINLLKTIYYGCFKK